ncbi:MAG: HAD family hydrolase [Anaerolineae bacterium]|jgi:HAD superfamily hydrolase (TIGR01549 family)
MTHLTAVDALLFDLDGTLLDSDDQAVAALARRLERLGFREPNRTARWLVMRLETPGNALVTLLDVVGLDGLLSGVSDQIHRWRGVRSPANFQMVAKSDEALETLAQHYRLAVVTTRGRREAEAFLDQFDLDRLFEVVVTRESTWRLKPHPAPVLHAAQALDLPPERCAMVGDTTVDVKSARRAGARAVAVLCGFGEADELEQAGAHMLLKSPAELPSALDLSSAHTG